MELILQQDLPHQRRGVEAIAAVFKEADFVANDFSYENPTLIGKVHSINPLEIQIKNLQKEFGVPKEYWRYTKVREKEPFVLDIKMETGTGKTYVYTSAMYELKQRFGINKFIVVVPTLPIKAGSQRFLEDNYTKEHFRDVCGYGTEIELQVLESMKSKKGKKFFPGAVRSFFDGTSQDKNKIYVLLTNMDHLTEAKNAMLNKSDYHNELQGFDAPIKMLQATKPFVIIDEPHRFSREQKTFNYIVNALQPQCILRFGATFPLISEGSGKNKSTRKDYENVLYNLNACDAFNQNLIKGIAKEHLIPLSQKDKKVKITSVENKNSVRFSFLEKGKNTKSFELQKGDSLSLIDDDFESISITGIGKNYVELSNGEIKFQGEEFSTDQYSHSYQEQMLELALDRHFETERENFAKKFKIKTLALFFIDDISSYRHDEKSEKKAYLKESFERLLSKKIKNILAILPENETEYCAYLEATLQDLSASHAGYFSIDNKDTDEAIAQQVNEILFDKKGLLSIKKEDGSYNTRRFLFSKWTLKEGWDNPNVFTIAKLRSSGSENSKIQEVGRGLRLPVDEFGNRVPSNEHRLNYIVDFTEADFAEKLVKEINAELPQGSFGLSKEMIWDTAIKLDIDTNQLFKELVMNDYLNFDGSINESKAEQFFEEYPLFKTGLNQGRIIDRNTKTERLIKIKKERFEELRNLWESINQRYILVYEPIEKDDFLKKELTKILENQVFVNMSISSVRQVLNTKSGVAQLQESGNKQYKIDKTLPYHLFLKKINKQTNLPIKLVHEAIVMYSQNHDLSNEKINEFSAANFITKFSEWKNNNLQGRFSYQKANLKRQETALTDANGNPKESIKQAVIGMKIKDDIDLKKYLYDTAAYDSPLERENILAEIDEVIVYGKIPRNSIAIPTITGQSYSPDFMYVVKKANGDKVLNIIVETKDVPEEASLRQIEKNKIECAKIFFEKLTIDGYKVEFHTQINNKKIKEIVEEVMMNFQ